MALAPTTSIAEISALLRGMGEEELADRLDYLASDSDLEPGESPATAESARGFFEFFSSVESEGRVGLGCSPEGVICAEWRFQDKRAVGIWFLDAEQVRFSAMDKTGEFVDVKERNKVADRILVTEALVEIQQELFVWRPS